MRLEAVAQSGEWAEHQRHPGHASNVGDRPSVLGASCRDGAADGIAALEHDQVEGHAAGLDPAGQRQLVERVERGQGQDPGQPADGQRDGDDRGDVDVAEDEARRRPARASRR